MSIKRLTAVGFPVVFVLLWSSGYLVGSIGARGGAELSLVAWRFLFALLVLGGFALLTRAPWPKDRRIWGHLLVIGVLLQTVQLDGIFFGLGHGVPAGLSSLIMSLSPLLVAAVAVPMFSERLAWQQWVGLGLGLGGVGISLSGRLSGAHSALGYVFTVVGLLGFTAGTLYQKRLGATVDLRTGTTIQLIGGTATSFPVAVLNGGLGLPLTREVLGPLVWLALVNSIGTFMLLFVLLRRRSGGAATSLLYLVPPVTALLGVPLLHQGIGLGVLVGMAVSGVGVLLVLWFAAPARPAPVQSASTTPGSRTAVPSPGASAPAAGPKPL